MMALGIGTVAGHSMKFVRRMILARLLAPAEIGVMAIVVSISIAFEAFAELGIKQSVIQNKRGANPDYLNVAWWAQMVRGLCLFAIAVVSVPWISSFYDKPELSRMLRICFLVILFRGLISPRAYILEKEYKFGRSVFLIQGSAILGVVVTIGLALVIRNVWALVIGFVVESATLCVLSYVLVPFLPRFRIDRESFEELMKFARGMFGLPILTMVSMQADIFVLGKLVETDQLGMYTLALQLAQQPCIIFGQVFGVILLPVFAENQHNKEVLCRHVRKVNRTTFVFFAPLAALAAIWAKPILSLAYGPRYSVVSTPFTIMFFVMFFRIQGHILASVYLAIGKPSLHRRFAILLAVLMVSLIYPSIKLFGLVGATLSLLIAYGAAVCLQAETMSRIIGLRFKDYISCWNPWLFFSRKTCHKEYVH